MLKVRIVPMVMSDGRVEYELCQDPVKDIVRSNQSAMSKCVSLAHVSNQYEACGAYHVDFAMACVVGRLDPQARRISEHLRASGTCHIVISEEQKVKDTKDHHPILRQR
jgi:hypothetical protein